MEQVEPVTQDARTLRSQVGPERWQTLVAGAHERVRIVRAVRDAPKQGVSMRKTLAEVAPGVHWSTYSHWRRRYQQRTGPEWERLLDERVPPPPHRVPEAIRSAACVLRQLAPETTPEQARAALCAQFQEAGDISDTSLYRIWSAAGLTRRGGPRSGQATETVETYSGGAGLALLAAAEVEAGAFRGLASAVLRAGKEQAARQGEVELADPWEGERDELGRLTSIYNHRWGELVEPGEADGRWSTDEVKRRRRDLGTLPTLSHHPETLARKLMCMGTVPLLTERRGFDGLDGPSGEWLGVYGGVAYMPATLDKALAEYGLLGVGEAMWDTHARTWNRVVARWSADGPEWLQFVVYVDATQDPYWTRAFAKSGKVSRTGRVMPCLSRVVVHSGPGVPLLVETHAGTASLKKRLLPLLGRLDEVVGEDEVGRLTVVDSEVATFGLLTALDEADRVFISVLKGHVLRGAEVEVTGDWLPYRKRDEVRPAWVTLRHKDFPGKPFRMRGVEMRRADSRRPTTTLFVSNSDPTELATLEIPSAYLSRWPHQEQKFRDGRNGGGGNRSHGYGGGVVTHVALETKLDKAERTASRAETAHAKAEQTQAELREPHALPRGEPRTKALELARQEVTRTRKALDRARSSRDKVRSMPRTIYVRDTGRDHVMACVKATVLLLIEWALREYFGGLSMEGRSFIEHFVMLPVTVRSTSARRVFEIHENRRQPERMAQLRVACDEINRRQLRQGKRRLEFQVVPAEAGS